MHSDDLNRFVERIEERQPYYEEKRKYYQLLTQKSDEYRDALKNIRKNLRKSSFGQGPDVYYFIHRFNHQ